MLVSYPLWQGPLTRLTDQPGMQVGLHGVQFGAEGEGRHVDTFAEISVAWAIGVLLLLCTPWVVYGLTRVDCAMVRGLLAPTTPTRRVRDLQASRSQALELAATDLRRIERDLHDGAQARMVAVAMDLGMARTKLATDPEAAAELVAQAHQESKWAIAELRDIARGIHPPLLSDRGLDGALPALTDRCRIPVDLTVRIGMRPASAVESIAYYTVAELLTNITKHARATHASVVAVRTGDLLTIEVSDDGIGGADTTAGRGLRGIAERLRTIDGILSITSPTGGPTTIRLELPCVS